MQIYSQTKSDYFILLAVDMLDGKAASKAA